jgi:hypothetical protein
VSPSPLFDDEVQATPAVTAVSKTGSQVDPVLALTLKANEEGLKKRRLAQAISPELQVPERPSKFRLVAAKLNLSQLFD